MLGRKVFTLIELIVVIAIIAILAAIIAPNVFRAIEKAKITRAIADFKSIKTACQSFYADTGEWPHVSRVQNSGLLLDPGGLLGWDGPYLEGSVGMHPWAGSYQISSNSDFRPQNGMNELSLEFEDYCYPRGPNYACILPIDSARKIDSMFDDGDERAGVFQKTGTGDYNLLLYRDVCASLPPPGGHCF
ncbi:MAG: type II secretion system protein GspG [Candidatus Omnitrophica bacterium]|nr:type II secretion system protein GspG [Candidatus Omnitrophota bacterium]